MNTTFLVEWEVFQAKYLNDIEVFVEETEVSWLFYGAKDGYIIKSLKEKSENPEENMLFITALAERPNITKIEGIETEKGIELSPPVSTPEIDPAPSPDGDIDAT